MINRMIFVNRVPGLENSGEKTLDMGKHKEPIIRYDIIFTRVHESHHILAHGPEEQKCNRKTKKLSYRRGTARCVVSIEILPIATQQCRNYLNDKS